MPAERGKEKRRESHDSTPALQPAAESFIFGNSPYAEHNSHDQILLLAIPSNITKCAISGILSPCHSQSWPKTTAEKGMRKKIRV